MTRAGSTRFRRIDLIDVFTAAGPVVVAGLGLVLVERVLGEATPTSLAAARRAQPAGAAAAVASLVVGRGATAGILASLWLAVCVCATVGGLAVGAREWVRPEGIPRLAAVTLAAGLAYLMVGGVWLVISRLGLRPLDLSTDIVRLTAVHFHYAGFGLSLLAAVGLVATDWLLSRVALVIGCLAAIAGPPLVATGFVRESAVGQVGGAVVMTVAAWATAFGTFLLATSSTGPAQGPGVAPATGRTLLVVAALSPAVPMVLAVQWALAQHSGLPALGIQTMAATHGVLNATFVVSGLVGWLLAGLATPGVPRPVRDPTTTPPGDGAQWAT
jgi:YndJ-like protein